MRFEEYKDKARELRIEQDRKIPKIRLRQQHIERCRLLLNRVALLHEMPKNSTVAELGVYKGDFSREIIKHTSPQRLHLVDPWETDRYNEGMMGQVQQEFREEIETGQVIIERDTSTEAVKRFPDGYFDWIYIDTTHSYLTTKAELESYASKIKPGGIIAGHDYITCNWRNSIKYGVIEAVHEFCVNSDWRFVYLTMEPIEKPSFAITRIS